MEIKRLKCWWSLAAAEDIADTPVVAAEVVFCTMQHILYHRAHMLCLWELAVSEGNYHGMDRTLSERKL